MVFSSPIFLFLFFPVTYLVYRGLPERKLQNVWLMLASLVFFSFGQLPYVLLLLVNVTGNYLFGLWLQTGRKRRLAVLLSVMLNLSGLIVFKYADFLLTCLNHLLRIHLPLPGLELPIGISFYTFQGMSYVLDVYRNPSCGTRSFPKLLLYISFFPQLIAGPIVLYRDVSAQIDERVCTPDLTLSGLQRLIQGLGKKMLLANTAGKVADSIFACAPEALDFRLAWLGAVCYTLQIYFDFSGYSDMAIGLGRLFGFQFQENFRLPYTAASLKEFWRRWHISLSSWFRDYLYIPLGGNRKGAAVTRRNKWIVFLATGLWHGANWTFLCWGLWHGLFTSLEGKFSANSGKQTWKRLLGHLWTMLIVILGFTIFRADSLTQAGQMFQSMFTGFSLTQAHTLTLLSLLDAKTFCLLCNAILFAFGLPQRVWNRLCHSEKFTPLKTPLTVLGYLAVFSWSILTLASSAYNPFIYFQF